MPVLASFAPDGFVRVQHRTGSRLVFELVQGWLGCPPHMMKQVSELTDANAEVMESLEIGLNTAEGQAQRVAQVGNQAGETHADAALVKHLTAEVELGGLPAL